MYVDTIATRYMYYIISRVYNGYESAELWYRLCKMSPQSPMASIKQ